MKKLNITPKMEKIDPKILLKKKKSEIVNSLIINDLKTELITICSID